MNRCNFSCFPGTRYSRSFNAKFIMCANGFDISLAESFKSPGGSLSTPADFLRFNDSSSFSIKITDTYSNLNVAFVLSL